MHLRTYAKTQACSLLSQRAPTPLFWASLHQEVPAFACLSCSLFWISHNVHCNSTQCCSLIGTQTIRPKRRLLLHLGGTQLLLQEVADLRFRLHQHKWNTLGYYYLIRYCLQLHCYILCGTKILQSVADLRHIYSTPFRLTAHLSRIHFQNRWSTTIDRGRVPKNLINAGNLA